MNEGVFMSKQYLFRVQILSKKDKHPLESIAYYSGEKQFDVVNAKNFDTTTEDKVIWSKILTPEKKSQFEQFMQLPDYLKFRSPKPDLISNARNILWQSVNNRENRPDSQFARLFEVSIPYFLNKEESVTLLTQFAHELILSGMIVDASIHNYNKQTPILSIMDKLRLINLTKDEKQEKISDLTDNNQDQTGFLMCTLRDYAEGRFMNKNRSWNDLNKLKEWRATWVEMLEQSIIASNATTEEKESWLNKLNIYPEFKNRARNDLNASYELTKRLATI